MYVSQSKFILLKKFFWVPQMNLVSRGNQTQEVSTNSTKRKSEIVDLNSDVRTSIRRKPDAFHRVIDLEKPWILMMRWKLLVALALATLPTKMASLKDGSCCISPENTSFAESLQLCRLQHITCKRCAVPAGSSISEKKRAGSKDVLAQESG